MPVCKPETLPKPGDSIFVSCPKRAAEMGVAQPGKLFPAVVTSVWGPEPSSLLSAVAFNDQPGPPAFAVQSIPHRMYVNLSQKNHDHWVRGPEEMGE